ncbi:sulfotransferase family protein [Virgibacillus sp. MSP4-1]|uniref:sulfotransferase n=1 Tax=Virgibacillus sp. MSP4-1 TaxID=2700081 RepID=UPI0003A4C44F|nr:sulfotransferase [Virgibacillus sp. MSP4-1]QHS23496.1 sulfotransferase family protein [Virgibacillus sp. MSP4-1]
MYKKRRLLVTGSHRSGSTFIGQMLSISSKVDYLYEPFNPRHGLEDINKHYLYLKNGMPNENEYRRLVNNFLAGKSYFKSTLDLNQKDPYLNKIVKKVLKSKPNLYYIKSKYNPLSDTILIKDPIASFMSEWLVQNFGFKVIVIVRHPAAFVASLKRVNWNFDFQRFFNQKHLMDDYLKDVLDYRISDLTKTERDSILWVCIHKVLFDFIDNNPNFIVVRHEDISLNPIEQFRELYRELGIPFNDHITKTIKKYTSSDIVVPDMETINELKRNSASNVKSWKNSLSYEEIETVKKLTNGYWQRYYKNYDW